MATRTEELGTGLTGRLPGRRTINLIGFLACAGMMAYALYAEYKLLMEPCPLCVFQRMAVISLGLLFLAAALHNPRTSLGRYVYTGAIVLAAGAGIGVAGRHVPLHGRRQAWVGIGGPVGHVAELE